MFLEDIRSWRPGRLPGGAVSTVMNLREYAYRGANTWTPFSSLPMKRA